jgi:integral membrane sensor domain MASE1
MIREAHLTQDSPAGSVRWQSILWIAGIALIYFLVARFSLSFIFKPEGIAAIWPPAGIFHSTRNKAGKEKRMSGFSRSTH